MVAEAKLSIPISMMLLFLYVATYILGGVVQGGERLDLIITS
jgi:hypothetical protein